MFTSVLIKIAKWILGMVDVDVSLKGDILTIIITLGEIRIIDWNVDLIPDATAKSNGVIKSIGKVKK